MIISMMVGYIHAFITQVQQDINIFLKILKQRYTYGRLMFTSLCLRNIDIAIYPLEKRIGQF